ncbi:MFS-type transporter SLC18B1 [Nymphon striatum]|nr:MFS-type transporter SLC18B1 [Nymphon striatum]
MIHMTDNKIYKLCWIGEQRVKSRENPIKWNIMLLKREPPVVDIPDFMAIHNEPEQERSKEIAANSGKLPPLIKSEKIMIVVLCICQFISNMSFAILAIFYPDAAYNKGLNAADVSYVFSAFFLGAFLFSPAIGILITKKGTKTVMVSSLFISALTVLLFAFTDYFQSNVSFLVSCIVLRFLQGIAFVGVQTSSFTIISHQFETRVGFLTGILEMCTGISYSLSNSLGGVLYQYGGYSAPFFTLFGLTILATILCWWAIPTSNDHLGNIENSVVKDIVSSKSTTDLFSDYSSLDNVHSTKRVCHLRTPIYANGIYTITNNGWVKYQRVWSPTISTLSTGITAVMVMGIGLVGGLVPLFKYILLQARDSGFESNFHTSSMVATLLSTVQSVGSFIGPLLGGQIIEKYGFEICFIFVGFFTIFAVSYTHSHIHLIKY